MAGRSVEIKSDSKINFVLFLLIHVHTVFR